MPIVETLGVALAACGVPVLLQQIRLIGFTRGGGTGAAAEGNPD